MVLVHKTTGTAEREGTELRRFPLDMCAMEPRTNLAPPLRARSVPSARARKGYGLLCMSRPDESGESVHFRLYKYGFPEKNKQTQFAVLGARKFCPVRIEPGCMSTILLPCAVLFQRSQSVPGGNWLVFLTRKTT